MLLIALPGLLPLLLVALPAGLLLPPLAVLLPIWPLAVLLAVGTLTVLSWLRLLGLALVASRLLTLLLFLLLFLGTVKSGEAVLANYVAILLRLLLILIGVDGVDFNALFIEGVNLKRP